MIQQVFKAYGLQATVDDSVRATQVRLDLDNVSFEVAARILGLVTTTFYVPLDEHRALVAHDTAKTAHSFCVRTGDRLPFGFDADGADEVAPWPKTSLIHNRPWWNPRRDNYHPRAGEDTSRLQHHHQPVARRPEPGAA